jgi:glutathione S-transferase
LDGDFKITQSTAILHYIARKYQKSLFGSSNEETTKIEMLEDVIKDFKSKFSIAYNPSFDLLVKGLLENLPSHLKQFEKYLGDKKWLMGEEITIVDFLFYEILDVAM